MKVTVTFEVSERAARLLLDNSIERVINQSVMLFEYWSDQADTDVNLTDWFDCKGIVVNMWNGVRDGVFRAKNDNMKQVSDWNLV